MKKLIITCALVTLGSMVSFAQSARKTHAGSNANVSSGQTQSVSIEKSAEARAKKLQKDLGLNATQYKGVYEAQLEHDKQGQAAKANGSEGPGQAMQLQMMLDQKFKEAMTPTQYTKYEQMKAAPSTQKAH